MRFANSMSWQVTWGSEHEVDVALYIRDALALSVADGQVLPPVEPAVPVHIPPGVDRAAVQEQWADWWTDLLAFLRNRTDPDPRFSHGRYRRPALAEDSAMRHAVAEFSPLASRHNATGDWATRRQRAGDGIVGELVREAEERTGRRARPFQLAIIEISVAGRVWQRQDQGQILVSNRFSSDRRALGGALRKVIDELA
ncbi:hypothetical protein [Amycolatopsis sp. H20-H5]|uniref:hypothetical protein n=1 Tax=Amycolatopsis sp. H20-H5 TaxID=3046309 RepID=UPI002DBC70AE|nr:hypothetical protein [Amycolatopsis sp. H20-H5]MEC3982158.1 hypothetical protein [Amycolatopsis sp. H20-H5]